ncbi:MAG: acyltransferase [Solobacterium sp.]|nr:acyltransferase [Solobacterium sp.]
MAKTRDTAIDFMRALAIVLILSAHCWFPKAWENFREFDVVMMFFLSGMSFGLSGFEFSGKNYVSYVKKRFVKLVLSVWVFLVFFFILFRFVPLQDFSTGTIIRSFALTAGGIMFVWVYRVFFVSALTTPLLDRVLGKQKIRYAVGIGLLCLVLNDLLYRYVLAGIANETVSDLLVYLISYTIGYGFTVYYGVLFARMEKNDRLWFTALFAMIFVGLSAYYRTFRLEAWKFPPQLFYLSYGLTWSGVLYEVLHTVHTEIPAVRWISVNCMNIYLGHILVFYLVDPIIANQALKFIVLLAGSCAFAGVIGLLKRTVGGKAV